MIVTLAGGVGAAKFLSGLAEVIPRDEITIIANTGDDAEFYGLHVSPDVDIVAYTLAGTVDQQKGWGIADDTFACLAALGGLGLETWFQLGDRDLATHIHRSDLLRRGKTLSEAIASLAGSLGLRCQILPMSDQKVRTKIVTPNGTLDFQEYMVRRRAEDDVQRVVFEGAGEAAPAPGVIEAIGSAGGIIVCPSNPIISIGPILAIQGIREALVRTPAPVAAISPIVGGAALKGPAGRMLASLGYQSSAAAVASLYRDFVDLFVLDDRDYDLKAEIEQLGPRVLVANTVMSGKAEKLALAEAVLEELSKMHGNQVGGR